MSNSTQNPWTNPLKRSYQDIKQSLFEKLKLKVPEITDYTEGNIFILILSIFAAIAEVIHYYIDNMARETFVTSARRYTSLYKHAKLIDYHIKCANPSSVDATLSVPITSPLSTDVVIPANLTFKDIQGNDWINPKSYVWPKGTYSITISLVEKKYQGETNFGVINYDNVSIPLYGVPSGYKYVEGSMVLKVGGVNAILVDTFAYSGPQDLVYKVELNESMVPTIIFGNGTQGKKPDIGSTVLGEFYITKGSSGNVSANSFSTVPSEITGSLPNATITNHLASAGGTDYESFASLKENLGLSIKTLGVAITKDDFQAIAMLSPGVGKAYVNYICGRYVEIYITPEGGGQASQNLLDATATRINRHKVITTEVSIKSTLECNIFIDATITGKPSYNQTDIDSMVRASLMNQYNSNNSDIGMPVRLSDIYALLDGLSLVDYLTINNLYLIPNISPNSPDSPNMTFQNFEINRYDSDEPLVDFNLLILENNQVQISNAYLNLKGTIGSPITVDIPVLGVNAVFTITNIAYNQGDTYTFSIQPMNRDLIPVGFNIPVIQNSNIFLSVNETV